MLNKWDNIFVFLELDVWNVYIVKNISIYQADSPETTDFFLQLPQNYIIPWGASRLKTLDQIGVWHNCSFYWHHPGFNNYNMGRLVK